jgi:hypothetical protein
LLLLPLLYPLNCSLSHDDLRQLASAALSAADVVRRTTLRRLKETYGHTKLQVCMYICDFTDVRAMLLAALASLLLQHV